MKIGEPLVVASRGPLAESVHSGHIAVTDDTGNLLHCAGDPEYVTFARSTAKPLQAIPLIALGAADKFAPLDREVAVICASHNGEPAHLAAVDGILRKAGLDASRLKCGVHEPFHRPEAENLMRSGRQPGVLHNNCSGKHAGMLALAKWLDAPLDSYDKSAHPVQVLAKETVYELAGLDAAAAVTATDGCGVPVFAMPLKALAFAYARFGRPDSLPSPVALACRRIAAALRREPFYLAGTGRFDTELIRATEGRLIGKAGAEGVYALTAPERRLGIAVKIADGAERALYPAVMEVLLQLELLTRDERGRLRRFHRPPVPNRRGEPVGEVAPCFTLHPGE